MEDQYLEVGKHAIELRSMVECKSPGVSCLFKTNLFASLSSFQGRQTSAAANIARTQVQFFDHEVVQAAENYVDRNTNEEGGGGYQAYNWDTCAWGAYVLLAGIQGADSAYPSKVSIQVPLAPELPLNEQQAFCHLLLWTKYATLQLMVIAVCIAWAALSMQASAARYSNERPNLICRFKAS